MVIIYLFNSEIDLHCDVSSLKWNDKLNSCLTNDTESYLDEKQSISAT